VFHVAAHIEADEENPWASRVILGSTDAGSAVVTVRDLEALEVRARLVVLSGCRSGRGRVFPGEGNVSLARVFLASGCGGVLTTEHEVEDRFCAFFMHRFFARLEESGGDAVRALHRARRDVSAEPAWRDPSHWANYRIYGIPGRIPLRARLPLAPICAILGVLIAVPPLVRAAKRRRP
jgi:CHAT domain-containing protein